MEPLTDRSVVLALQELTEELGEGVLDVAPDAEEATALLAALCAAAEIEPPDVGALAEPHAALASAHRLFDYLLTDPDTAGPARQVAADPPQDSQLSVETVVVSAVVLGAVIAWLQTKVDIRFTRTAGKSEFEFRLTKSAASQATLRRLAEIVGGVLTGGGAPRQ